MALAAQGARTSDLAQPRWRLATTLPDVAWLAVAQAASGASAFVASLLRARALSLGEFGAYALVATVVAFLVIVADFGLSVMMVRDLSRTNLDRRAYLASSFVLTAVLATIAATAVVGVSLAISRDGEITPLAIALASSVWLAGLSLAPAAFLRATGRTRIEAAARLASGSVLVALTSFVGATHGGVALFGASTAAASCVALFVMLPAAMRGVGARWPRIDVEQWRRLFVDAAPLGFAMLFTSVYYYADSLMLGAFGQREGLARYNAAYVFVMAVALLITALRTGFMPPQARGHGGQAPLDRVLRAYFWITAAMGLGRYWRIRCCMSATECATSQPRRRCGFC
jgi:O-antigen/teichoic acid export membrane protein